MEVVWSRRAISDLGRVDQGSEAARRSGAGTGPFPHSRTRLYLRCQGKGPRDVASGDPYRPSELLQALKLGKGNRLSLFGVPALP